VALVNEHDIPAALSDDASMTRQNAGAVDVQYFNTLYGAADDPWSIKTRWYEARKRKLLDAVLPRERFHRAFEPGCGNGDFTALLLERCDAVVAMDLHPRAVSQARARFPGCGRIAITQGTLPDDWPPGKFDLIVVSELGYYFDVGNWARFVERLEGALADDAVVVACHWRDAFDARQLETKAVHDAFTNVNGLTHQVAHRERDFLLDVWTRDLHSVAQREGLA